MWGWLEQASNQAKELVTQAQVVAAEISKQAIEIKENYNAEVQKSILLAVENESNHKNSIKVLLPRETTKLEEIDLVYITENIIGMGYPHDPRKEMNIKGNRIDDVSGYLKVHHNGRYMIWNISEETYDYSLFSDQVLEYKFPGHPAPPLGLMFKICTSIESWLDADTRNVAIVHCLTGKGRTAVVLACALTWIGEFSSPMEALNYIAERKKSSIDFLTIPSQRRYIQYFSNVLDGVKPHGDPLLLRRVVMNGIPKYGENKLDGCCPYLQLFKNGKILANGIIALPTNEVETEINNNKSDNNNDNNNKSDNLTPVRWLNCNEGSVSFQIDCIVQGDLLIRCRHHDIITGARISMFRAAFHTGYVSNGILRLTKAQLDGPNHDDRYGNDFFIDLIFAPVGKNTNSQNITNNNNNNNNNGLTDSGTTLDSNISDKFEQMFHRDTRFWETISTRKLKTKKRTSRKFQLEVAEKFSILDDSKKRSEFEVDHIDHIDDSDVVHFFKSDSNDGIIKKDPNELSDDELIKQLTQAADDVELNYTLNQPSLLSIPNKTNESNKNNESNENNIGNVESLENLESEEKKLSITLPSFLPDFENKNSSNNKIDETIQVSNSSVINEINLKFDDNLMDDIFKPTTIITTTTTIPTSTSTISPPVTKPINTTNTTIQKSSIVTSAGTELQALEDLEKELGLDLGSTIKTTTSSVTSTLPKSQSNITKDDGLDDLEDFLESLNK